MTRTSRQRECRGCSTWFPDPGPGKRDAPAGYCSSDCHQASKPVRAPARNAGPRTKSCERCGAEYTPPSDCATRQAKYCTRECGWAAQRERAAAALPSRDALLELYVQKGMSVAAVGDHFGRSAWWAKNALAAHGIPERPRVLRRQQVTCPCGSTFEAKASEVKRGKARFCSVACRGKYTPAPSKRPGAAAKISAAKTGPRNAAFKTGLDPSTVSRVVNLRVKGEPTCRHCGSADNLHLHHVIPRSMWRAGIKNILNCIPLCARCHVGWHRRYVTIHRDVLTSEEWECVSSAQLVGQNVAAWLDDRYPPRRP